MILQEMRRAFPGHPIAPEPLSTTGSAFSPITSRPSSYLITNGIHGDGLLTAFLLGRGSQGKPALRAPSPTPSAPSSFWTYTVLHPSPAPLLVGSGWPGMGKLEVLETRSQGGVGVGVGGSAERPPAFTGRQLQVGSK